MKTRRPLIAGNWKMYKTVNEAVETAQKLVSLTMDVESVDIMIAPTFVSLYSVFQAIEGSRIDLGGQNLHWEEEGAYTGEISAKMIKSTNCKYVIIGHSERRQYFGETDDKVNKKIKAAIASGLIPVVCIGETENQRDAQETFSILDKQIKNGLSNVSADDLKTLVIAYEPVWAIGTGKTATKEQAQEVHEYIRGLLEKDYGTALSQQTRILYGGSVKPNNIAELMAMTDVDGALVGGASLNAETFNQIIHY